MQTPRGEINDKVMELVKDEEILKKMTEAKTPEECYDVVKDRINISFEDFQSSMSVALAYLQESESGELSEDDLDAVAGGKSTAQVIGDVSGVVGGVAAVAAGAISAAAGAFCS